MLPYEAGARQRLGPLLKPYDTIGRDLILVAEHVWREAADVHDATGRPWRHLCTIMFLYEGTRRFRGAQLVADAGLDRECKILVRALLEVVVRCNYLCREVDPDHWPAPPQGVTLNDAIAFYFLHIRPQRDIEAFIKESTEFPGSNGQDDLAEDATNVEVVRVQVCAERDRLVADGWESWLTTRPPSLLRMAECAGLKHYYTLIYGDAGFSADVHASSANKAFDVAPDGREATLAATDTCAVVQTVKLAHNLLFLLTATVADSMEIEFEATWKEFTQRLWDLPEPSMPGR